MNAVSANNLLLAGVLTAGTDDFFRGMKFFLQILAGVTNTSIVRDPVGYINQGTQIKVPFPLSEADINARVILLTDHPVVRLAVQAPDGIVIDEAAGPGVNMEFKRDGTTEFATYNLPLPLPLPLAQPGHAGTWHAILEIDQRDYKRTLSILRDKDPDAAQRFLAKGAQYCLALFHDIHGDPGKPEPGRDDLCRLLSCLLNEKNLTPQFANGCASEA